ncbi:hypothetical protein RI367_005027 [Sorochytrium milnesiophthora]
MAPQLQLPQAFADYLERHDIAADVYDVQVPRYFRVAPGAELAVTLDDLRRGLGCDQVEPVPWLPRFFQMPSSVGLASCALYKDGKILGMDVSSAVAVHALDVQPTDHVLDLCCAPGAKLVYLSQLQMADNRDALDHTTQGTVTGVDVASHRLATCRSLLKKYRTGNVRLFLADGTTFSVRAPHASVERMQKRTKISGAAAIVPPFYAPKWMRQDPQLASDDHLYDRVLVDAECTHDGSVAHVAKYGTAWDMDAMQDQVRLSDEQLENLQVLQRGLIRQGWRLLKPGGVLVYSTCSLARRQNEDVVMWLLQQCPDAELTAVPAHDTYPHNREYSDAHNSPDQNGGVDLRHCLRFDPPSSNTSGMFIALFVKKKQSSSAS